MHIKNGKIMSDSEAIENAVKQRQHDCMGKRYVGATLSSIRGETWVQQKIINFLEKPQNFLVYCGSPGIGKTHLCASLVEWMMKSYGFNWRYYTEDKLLKELRTSMDTVRGDYLDVLKYMIDDDFLIVDDIGSSTKHTEWREEILFAILDSRYNSMKPTVFTSNFCQKEFKEKYHHRIHSRLFSTENTIIEIEKGVDFRLIEKSKIENKIEKP